MELKGCCLLVYLELYNLSKMLQIMICAVIFITDELFHIEARPVAVAEIRGAICITSHVLQSLGGRVLLY